MLLMMLFVLQNDLIEQKWEGKGSKNKQTGVNLISDGAAWKNLWERHAGEKEEPPKVNFDTHWVVAVFPEGEYHHLSSSAEADDKEITVRIILGGKEANAYAPYHSMLLLRRTKKPIRVIVQVNSCTGIDPSRDRVFVLNAR